MPEFGIILVAAGSSTRMGFPKLWVEIEGRPLIAHAVDAALQARPLELILVATADRLAACEQIIARALPTSVTSRSVIVPGGARRRDSVAAGLAAATADWVAVHDAARALAPADLFARGLEAAQATGAAVPGVPLTDTIKRVAADIVIETPPRSEYVAVQTPQIFRRGLLVRALALSDDDVTDEAALVERLGVNVAVFAGSDRAFKVTTPRDLDIARALIQADSSLNSACTA